jgi:hypothetical protein
MLLGRALLQAGKVRTLNHRLDELERRIGSWQRRQEECERLAEYPGSAI